MRAIICFLVLVSYQYSYSQKDIHLNVVRNSDRSVDFYYSKEVPGSFYLYIDFKNIQNTISPIGSYNIKYPEGKLFTLKPNDPRKNITYSYHFSYVRGIPNPRVDSLFTYLLPFKKNARVGVRFSYFVGSKYLGQEEPKNWKSFSFKREKADTVCSIRKGLVVSVTDKFPIDTSEVYSYKSNINVIIVEHSDGTLARYQGLDGNNIFVKPGDTVWPNQPLGTLIQYDKSGSYQLLLSIVFLTGDNLELRSEVKLKDKRSYYQHVDPYFLTSQGNRRLMDHKKYITIISDEVMTKELSRKERKKLEKESNQ